MADDNITREDVLFGFENYKPDWAMRVIEEHYRWWTFSVSRDHVKLGPLAVTWFRWPPENHWRVEACWLCREPFMRLGGPL